MENEKGFGRKMTIGDKVRMAVWALLVLLFALWMASWIPLLALPFVVDLYWMHYINWYWWKDLKNSFLRGLMSWVDAIVFALCAVWVLQNFFFQNFQIPTTSLEKSMMAGDYLMVSKYHYGPRVPMTPLSLPLFQHTIAIGKSTFGKSYLEQPQVDYRRMPGLGSVERGDIVVFNYPNGDTVCTKCENPDYYDLCRQYGREALRRDKAQWGEVVYRPVDRRENYVKRCIGLPGETIKISDGAVYADGKEVAPAPGQQHIYYVLTNGHPITERYWRELGVYTRGNQETLGADVMEINNPQFYAVMGIAPDSVSGKYAPMYQANLTREMVERLEKSGKVARVFERPSAMDPYGIVYPQEAGYDWTPSNYGPLWIPKRGAQIELTDENVLRYGRCIRAYEPNQATGHGQGNTLERAADGQGWLLNGQPATTFTFAMDYYWMMGDNRDNSADSRFWGFVPEDHIVGTPLFVWFSINQETGEWRKDRWFKRVKGNI